MLPAMDQICSIVRAFLVLLTPVPVKNSQAKDATQARKYNGDSLFLCSVRDLLVQNDGWNKLYEDLVLRGASTITMQAELEDLLTQFREKEVNLAMLQSILCRLPVLKKQTRSGATASLEKVVYKKVVAVANMLGQFEGLTTSFVTAIGKVLMMFKETQGVLQLLGKVEQYKKQHGSELASEEVLAMLKSFPADKDVDLPADLEASTQCLVVALRQFETVGLNVKRGLKVALFWNFRMLNLKFEVWSRLGSQMGH